MFYLPIGVITLRFCKILDSTFFLFLDSTLFCLDSTIWLDCTLKLYYGDIMANLDDDSTNHRGQTLGRGSTKTDRRKCR